jgi:hypothetical protein
MSSARINYFFFEKLDVSDDPAPNVAGASVSQRHLGKIPLQRKKIKVPESDCRFSNQSESELGVDL